MRDDDDGTVALDDVGARRAMDADDVLATRRRPNGGERVGTTPRQKDQDEGQRSDGKTHQRHDRANKARQDDAYEKYHQVDVGREACQGGRLKLLELCLETVLGEEALDKLSGIELLLAVRRSNIDLIVKVVGIVARCGHVCVPRLAVAILGIHPSSIRQCRLCTPTNAFTKFGSRRAIRYLNVLRLK